MPRLPKPGCKYPGCTKRAKPNCQYCEEHQKMINASYENYQRHYASKKRYGSSWRKLRDQYLSTHPLCECCMEKGILRKATLVHHIKPISQGGTNDPDNLQSLCGSCHKRIHMHMHDVYHY